MLKRKYCQEYCDAKKGGRSCLTTTAGIGLGLAGSDQSQLFATAKKPSPRPVAREAGGWRPAASHFSACCRGGYFGGKGAAIYFQFILDAASLMLPQHWHRC